MEKKGHSKAVKWFWFIILFPVASLALVLILVGLFAKIPSFEQLENPESNLATLLISEDGKVINTYHIENRIRVEYEDIPQHLIDAVIATEDVRYYKHCGVDFRGLARVAVKTLLLGDKSQGGGSTITQQLAKNLYKTRQSESDSQDSNVTKKNSGGFPGSKKINLFIAKFKEWITAVKLERNYTKKEIVTMYLNTYEFGSNSFGINTASHTFFAKEPKDLTIEEGACIVAMLNKATEYNPATNPEKAIVRRNYVLKQMERGNYLGKNECDSIMQLPIVVNYHRQDHNAGGAPYFRDMLRRTMNAQEPVRSSYAQVEDFRVDSLAWADDPLYGWLTKNKKPDGTKYDLFRDGLRIYTTIDSRMQQYAEEAVVEHLSKDLQKSFNVDIRYKRNRPFSDDVPSEIIDLLMKQAMRWSDRYMEQKKAGVSEDDIRKSFGVPTKMRLFAWNEKGYIDTVMTPKDSIKYYKSFLRSAFIALEPNTGHVKAYVGGPDYKFFKYDNARQGKRQVGSTIKPYLYTLAMQEGYTPCDRVKNIPYSFPVLDTVWTPKSTDKDEYIGKTVTLKWGLTHSSNNISAYLMKQFGPKAMVDMCRKLGIGSFLDPVYSLCVGSCDLNVYEMVSAYNTFPSRGVYCYPMLVTRIEDNSGNVLANFSSRKKEAISDVTAYLMVNLMEGVVNEGTAGRLKWKYGLQGELAGKTGTTNDQSDGWFIGYTPKLTAGVWVGAEDRQVHFESLALGGGANMALPIWGLFMQKVYNDTSIPIGKEDRFVSPLGWNMDLRCTGAEDDMTAGSLDETDQEGFFN